MTSRRVEPLRPLAACAAAASAALLMLLALWTALPAAAPPVEVVHLGSIEWLLSDSPTPPPDDAGWQRAEMPLRWSKTDDTTLVRVWYRARFELPAGSSDLMAVYLPEFGSGGTLWINSQKIGDVRTMDSRTQVRWFRPFLFPIGSEMLDSRQNVLTIRQQTRDMHNGLRDIAIGSHDELQKRHQSLLFWQYTMAVLAAWFCVVVGTFMVALWLRRRDERLIAIFGFACLLWALRSLTLIIEVIPVQWWLEWRTTYYAATSGFIAAMSMGLVRFADHRPRWHMPLALGYSALGVAVFVVVGWPARPWLDQVWVLGFVPFMLHAMWLLAKAARREPGPSKLLLLLALIVAGAMAVHDYVVGQGSTALLTRAQFFGLHLATPVVLAALGLHLLDRFVRSLAEAERLNRTLEQQVAERERELAENFQRLRLLEREQALAAERQRIMREMHDGVGSQLLSSLVMVERGAARQQDIARMLRECLDDMRLAIDTLTPETANLVGALGNLRYRLESRLQAAGIGSRWDISSLPETLPVNPHQSLQLLRVVQEALANVFKHAGAERVDVSARIDADRLVLEVSDDGRGFDPRTVVTGRGLRNMQRRAQEVGATLQLDSGLGGTRIRLVRPLSATASEQEGGARAPSTRWTGRPAPDREAAAARYQGAEP